MKNNFIRNNIWRIVSVALCMLCVGFIFGNSLDNAARSSDKSGAVVAVLQGIVDVFTDDATVNEGFVRTAAHFAEFLLLGFLLLLSVKTFTQKYMRNIFVALFTALSVAVTDEILQMFSAGRVSDVADVIVDFSGAVTGMLIFILIDFVRRRVKVGGKKQTETKEMV